MTLINRLQQFIMAEQLVTGNDNLLLAISGGLDSCVMLHCFTNLDIPVAVAHCNFGLRGTDSDEDELLVQTLAQEYNVPFHSKNFETKAYASEEGISIQMSARSLRYDWFDELCNEFGYSKIATGHHLDDSVETVLFNLIKGTGIRGLGGIPVKSGPVVRPMLCFRKKELLEFANTNQLRWREDASNREHHYVRNKIRNQIIPLMEEINPGVVDSIARSLKRLQAAGHFYSKEIARLKEEAFSERNGEILIRKSVLKNTPYAAEMLFEWIREFGFNYLQCIDILNTVDSGGKTFYANKYQLINDRSELIITKTQDIEYKPIVLSSLPDSFTAFGLSFQFTISENKPEFTKKDAAYLDLDKIKLPITLRKWEKGDAFHPLGMSNKKKLSDFMIDRKIPLNLKSRVFVLISDDMIFWVVGQRIDDRFKIDDLTTRFLTITIKDEPESL